MNRYIEKILGVIPLLVFFTTYYLKGIFFATISLMIASAVSVAYMLYSKIKVPLPVLLSNAILIVFGSITLLSGNPVFIKMKPTILYCVFIVILVYDRIAKKGLLSSVFDKFLELDESIYKVISTQWIAFFFICASLNEFVWRNFSEQFWISFKVFGMFIITFVFSMIQYICVKGKIKR